MGTDISNGRIPMISLIIPIYNEEEILRKYDRDFFPAVESLKIQYGEDFEIVFVDDTSRDSSWDIITGYVKNRADTIGVHHEKNRGMGGALKTGIEKSHGNLLIFLDADLTFRPADIKILLDEYYRNPADCISGSPYLEPGLMADVQPLRMFLSKSVNLLYRALLRKPVTSVSPIFRLYHREVFSRLFLSSENFEINSEILSKMIFLDMTIREVPIALHERKFGKSKAELSKSIKNHLRILYKIFMVKYLKREWT
jgi:dolichol-phosphate mannosyltransferase